MKGFNTMTDEHHLHAVSAESTSEVEIAATGRIIANFAWQHMKAATTFRDQVIAIEEQNTGEEYGPFFEDIRTYGSGCIMSAAASLEALINELFIDPNKPLRQMLGDFETEFWGRGGIEWKSPLKKYQIALEMLGLEKLDEHTSPYRDAWALIELRNALVHYKPTWDPDRQRKVALVEVLGGKYQLSPFLDGSNDFVSMESISADCMRWVIETVIGFIQEFNVRTRLDDSKMSQLLKFGT